jgi:peptidyl-prolyl cis-trans isomerase D
MALINKIREKSGWAVGAIAIGLGIFVVGGDLLGPNSRLLGNDTNIIGEIAGEEVEYQEFDAVLQQIKANYESRTGRAANEGEMALLREQAWNQLIFKIALEKEYERLGIEVTEDELFDMVQGNNIHPAVRESFTNPQTGEFDRNQVIQYLQNLDQMGPEARPMWTSFEQNLISERVQTKYNNLLTKSVYITDAEAKRYYNAQNSTASLKVLYVPFFTVVDSTVKVTDSQLQDYYERNKELYKVEAARSIEYVTIPVSASKEDSTYFQEEIATVSKQFAAVENDSAFVSANSDAVYDGIYRGPSQLPQQLVSILPLEKGKLYGPYTEDNTFSLYKVVDVKEGAASAKASHILFKPENDTPEAKAAAKAKANEVLTQIKGGADFAQMAMQHGGDGTASIGGDLGWFEEGRMVAPFEKAVFGATSTGLLPNLVETDFGYHIIKITEPKTTKSYKVAAIQRAIDPSDATRDQAYSIADELSGISNNIEEFKANIAKNPTLVTEQASEIGKNNVVAGNLSNARELVRWTYAKDTEVGDVSPVFEINDQFVVAVLTNKREKGYAKVESIKEELTAAVRNELKAKQIIEKLKGVKGGTLDQIAANYGKDAIIRSADEVNLAASTMPGVGYEPAVIGKAFGLKQGARTAPFEGQSGVAIVELVQLNAAAAPADLSAIKQQMQSSLSAGVETKAYEAIKEKSEIKDNRVRFF